MLHYFKQRGLPGLRFYPSVQEADSGQIAAFANLINKVETQEEPLAWLLRHPSGIIPIVGSTKPDRIKDAVQATTLTLSREEWYRLFEAARGQRLP